MGIGVTDPDAALEITGRLHLDDHIHWGNPDNADIYSGATSELVIQAVTYGLRLNPGNGLTSIGTGTADYKLHIWGNSGKYFSFFCTRYN